MWLNQHILRRSQQTDPFKIKSYEDTNFNSQHFKFQFKYKLKFLWTSERALEMFYFILILLCFVSLFPPIQIRNETYFIQIMLIVWLQKVFMLLIKVAFTEKVKCNMSFLLIRDLLLNLIRTRRSYLNISCPICRPLIAHHYDETNSSQAMCLALL